MDKFDILYTITDNYIDIFLVSLYSFLKNSKIENLRVHLITSNFKQEDYNRVEQFISMYNNVEIYFYPLEEFNIEKYNIPNWRGTQIANSRLFFQDILKDNLKDISSLLYLDSDTITVGDINDIKSYTDGVYAVKDGGLKEYAKSLNLDRYYNSGVIYIDIENWLSKEYQERILHLINKNEINLTFPDQDILNCAIGTSIKELPISYNLLSTAYKLDGLLARIYFNGNKRNISYEEIKTAKKNPKILHGYGLGGIKPWSSSINPYYNIFINYMKQINHDYVPQEIVELGLTAKLPEDLYNLVIALRPYAPKTVKQGIKKLVNFSRKK